MFTDFALVKAMSPGTTWVVAGVMSDAGFAEVDALVRFRESDRHSTSARLSLGILPYLAESLTPLMDRNVKRLNTYNLDLQDEVRLSAMLSVIYGAELQLTDPSSGSSRFRPRWGLKFRPSAERGFTFLRTSSLPQMEKTLELEEGDSIEITSPFQHEFGNRLNFGVSRVTHTEASASQSVGPTSQVVVGVYSDDFSANRWLLSAESARPFIASRGVRVAYKRSFAAADTVMGYTYGTGLKTDPDFSQLTARNFHLLTAQVKSEIPATGTHVAATYRWISGNSITIIDPYQDLFDSAAPGISLMFVQAIPYFGRLIPGKLEAQLDVRNLLSKVDPGLYQSTTLRRVEFLQPARSLRGGIKLKF
jgi:hypothetical protein